MQHFRVCTLDNSRDEFPAAGPAAAPGEFVSGILVVEDRDVHHDEHTSMQRCIPLRSIADVGGDYSDGGVLALPSLL